MTLLYIFIACLVVMLASLSGVLFLAGKLSTWTNRNLKYLISFSSGIFIIVCYYLITEALEESMSLGVGIGSIILGLIVLHLFSKIFPEFHHHHEPDADHTHSIIGIRRILFSDSIHNIGDGIVVASAFLANTYLGIATTVSIFIHEAVQEISEFFLLKEGGYSTREALSKNILTSSTILIGALLGYYFSSSEIILGPLLGFAAGAFLYILINDLIPHSLQTSKKEKAYIRHIAWVLLGALVIFTVNYYFAHGHEEEQTAGTPLVD